MCALQSGDGGVSVLRCVFESFPQLLSLFSVFLLSLQFSKEAVSHLLISQRLTSWSLLACFMLHVTSCVLLRASSFLGLLQFGLKYSLNILRPLSDRQQLCIKKNVFNVFIFAYRHGEDDLYQDVGWRTQIWRRRWVSHTHTHTQPCRNRHTLTCTLCFRWGSHPERQLQASDHQPEVQGLLNQSITNQHQSTVTNIQVFILNMT